MAPVWDWMRSRLAGLDPAAMNLFGYTGVGTLALSASGREHGHACRCVEEIGRGRRARMRRSPAWRMLPSAGSSTTRQKFTAREVRRARRYDGIILDPPKFGRGPDGEVWRLEEHLAPPRRRLPQAARCGQPFPVPHRLCRAHVGAGDRRTARQMFADLPGRVECGELAVREEARGLLLPTAIWARWSAE
ncbi:MAG: class I SAM-dependent rRNA methyltransferase [Sphingobium sp.]|jgi:23S rRNA (cytosine1962-C5)-methyltransferase|nr:class I SAM-dependent rRNA methyltransferase [Sphingobium sp.]